MQSSDIDLGQQRSVQLPIILGSILAIALAVLQGYANRTHVYQKDAISYLDISDAILQGNWQQVVNTHWSPLYSFILAGVRSMIGTAAQQDTLSLKIANFFNFVLLLAAFNWFLLVFLKFLRQSRDDKFLAVPQFAVIASLFCYFYWCSLTLCGVYVDTPDQFAFASIVAATAIVMQVRSGATNKLYGIALGVIFGLGYLDKAATMPIALIYFAIILFSTHINLRLRAQIIGLFAFFFILLASPWVYLLSTKVGHLTFSESSWLAYIVYVQKTSHFFRPVMNPAMFEHPARILCSRPVTLEFATPIGGTYPLWTDPAYWNQGIKIHPSFAVVPQIFANFLYYILLLGVPASAYLVQYAACFPRLFPVRGLSKTWPLWLPGFAGLLMYMVAIPMFILGVNRYIPAFIILLAATILGSLRIKSGGKGIVTMLLTFAIFCSWPLIDMVQEVQTDLTLATTTPVNRFWRIAEELKKYGVTPGSNVSLLGDDQAEGCYRCAPFASPIARVQPAPYYWARLARVRIIAHVTPVGTLKAEQYDLWNCNDSQRAKLYSALTALNVKAIVYNPSNDADLLESGNRAQAEDFARKPLAKVTAPPGFRELDHLGCYVYLLSDFKK